jgi:hypothetical protein
MIEIPIQLIEIEKDSYHILIEGFFEDDFSCDWIVDTGASRTVFDKNLEDYYRIDNMDDAIEFRGAGIDHQMVETKIGTMKYVRFSTFEIRDLNVALIDLGHINEIYWETTSRKIAGLIGGDILMKYKCRIDYAAKNLRFNITPSLLDSRKTT